jgi:hypothetical protein
MISVEVIKAQHPKKTKAKCQTIEGKPNPLEKTNKFI